jgi:hypothetical protein
MHFCREQRRCWSILSHDQQIDIVSKYFLPLLCFIVGDCCFKYKVKLFCTLLHAKCVRACNLTEAVVQLGVDVMMHLVMETWLEQRAKDEEAVLHIFQITNPTGRGVVSLDDFKSMMRCMDLHQASLLPDRIVHVMFREALCASGDAGYVKSGPFFQVMF